MRDHSPGGFDRLVAPGPLPALLDGIGEAWRFHRRKPFAQQRTENSVDQPARAAVDQRQRRGHRGVIGRAEADLLGQCQPDHHPGF